jgi:putative transposase
MNIINDILEPDSYYHVYNRGINSCIIFNNQDNYRYFLKQFSKYMIEVVDVYAYCLMPNHFHFLFKVKSKEELETFVQVSNFDKGSASLKGNQDGGLHATSNIVSKQMGKFISSYSQAFNKVHTRHGALLESPFKRIRVDSEEYLKNLIIYIHLNPLDIRMNYEHYPFSSFSSMLSKSKSNLKRDAVLQLFENADNFKFCHRYPPKFDFKF